VGKAFAGGDVTSNLSRRSAKCGGRCSWVVVPGGLQATGMHLLQEVCGSCNFESCYSAVFSFREPSKYLILVKILVIT